MMKKILILDDNKATLMLYADELSHEGYEVITLRDASKLLSTIRQKRPELIILDIKLGRYNGLDLLQDIRNTNYDLPVILCTAYSGFKYDLRSIAADYYVVKSSNLEELKLKIKMAVEGNEQFLGRVGPNHLQQMHAP